MPSFPQVSMCGIYAPERYIFTLGMNVSAILLAILLLINHYRKFESGHQDSWELYTRLSAGVQLGVGLAATVCLALMGTIPVSEFPIPHVLFAACFFSLLVVFQVWNSTERICMRSRTFSTLSMEQQNLSIMKETWMVAWMVVTAVSFVTWQTTGNSIVQYIAISAVLLYFRCSSEGLFPFPPRLTRWQPLHHRAARRVGGRRDQLRGGRGGRGSWLLPVVVGNMPV